LASSVITSGLVLPSVVTIRQLCIDLEGRVEILVYEQNRFIKSQIRKRLKEARTLTEGGGLSLL
jgi:hypothetical protein